jgi:hypothetical protein
MSAARVLSHPLAVVLVLTSCAPLPAQAPGDVLWEAYAESVVYPEAFDLYLLERIVADDSPFDNGFKAHLQNVMSRLAVSSADHRAICDQHPDPNSRWQCLGEDIASQLFAWCGCLYQAVADDELWSDTFCGRNMIFAKRTVEGSGYDYVALSTDALGALEPQLRGLFQ